MTERYKAIPLTRGCFAIVDPENFDWLMQWKWYARFGRKTVYATRDQRRQGGSLVHMHRVIVDAPPGIEVDHRDLNGLNNTLMNLRLGTPGENRRNSGVRTNNSSGYKGVSLSYGKYWVAHIQIKGKQTNLGTFPTAEAAARAYDDAARALFGEFAWLNFDS